MELAQGLLPLASAVIYQAQHRAERTERDTAAARLKAQYPELVSPSETKGGSLIAAAKNIRTQLKNAFPGVKFTVKTERYSGGDSLRVSWVDGPENCRVEQIVDRYQAGSFDGMTDCYNYEHSAWTDAFGDAKYVFACRDYSPDLVAWANESNDYDTQRRRGYVLQHLNIKAVKSAEA